MSSTKLFSFVNLHWNLKIWPKRNRFSLGQATLWFRYKIWKHALFSKTIDQMKKISSKIILFYISNRRAGPIWFIFNRSEKQFYISMYRQDTEFCLAEKLNIFDIVEPSPPLNFMPPSFARGGFSRGVMFVINKYAKKIISTKFDTFMSDTKLRLIFDHNSLHQYNRSVAVPNTINLM